MQHNTRIGTDYSRLLQKTALLISMSALCLSATSAAHASGSAGEVLGNLFLQLIAMLTLGTQGIFLWRRSELKVPFRKRHLAFSFVLTLICTYLVLVITRVITPLGYKANAHWTEIFGLLLMPFVFAVISVWLYRSRKQ